MKKFLFSCHQFVVTNVFVALLILPAFAFADQTPWKTTVGNGSPQTNLNWPGYNTGYEFTVLADGEITKLGGFFNGTKTVRLYNSSGVQVAIVNTTDSNSWGYASVSSVAVAAGEKYTVAVQTGWGGASMYIGAFGCCGPVFPTFPHVVGDIQINKAVFGFGTNRPTWELWGQMWGQADITFVAD